MFETSTNFELLPQPYGNFILPQTPDLCEPYRKEFCKTEVFLELQSSSEPAIPVRHEAKALQSEHGVPVSKACKKLEPNVTSSPLPLQRTAMELLDFQIVPGIETSSVRFIRTLNTTAESSSTSSGDSNNLSDTSAWLAFLFFLAFLAVRLPETVAAEEVDDSPWSSLLSLTLFG
uniref:Uncharacterized protein n=1 Tax=Glossina palpalis gambiensis TaxID=67801 RepID=A0A1B0B1W8_9MUSC